MEDFKEKMLEYCINQVRIVGQDYTYAVYTLKEKFGYTEEDIKKLDK